jgi:hypothetical protein
LKPFPGFKTKWLFFSHPEMTAFFCLRVDHFRDTQNADRAPDAGFGVQIRPRGG